MHSNAVISEQKLGSRSSQRFSHSVSEPSIGLSGPREGLLSAGNSTTNSMTRWPSHVSFDSQQQDPVVATAAAGHRELPASRDRRTDFPPVGVQLGSMSGCSGGSLHSGGGTRATTIKAAVSTGTPLTDVAGDASDCESSGGFQHRRQRFDSMGAVTPGSHGGPMVGPFPTVKSAQGSPQTPSILRDTVTPSILRDTVTPSILRDTVTPSVLTRNSRLCGLFSPEPHQKVCARLPVCLQHCAEV